MKTKQKILIGIIIILIIIQFIRINKTNPPIIPEKDFLTITHAPASVKTLIKTTCYDCHSNETKYPWYSNIAPISWLIANHRDEGREHVNFSIWSDYNQDQKNHILEECIETIEKNEMPMKSYLLTHSDAKLSSENKILLIEWLKNIKK